MPVQKVTFVLSAEVVADASNGLLLGEFNNWDIENGFSLKKSKDGSMKATVSLEGGRSYQYRYLLEGGRWENDHNAHGYTQVEGLDIVNCVVHVPAPEEQESAPKAAKSASTAAKPEGKKVSLPAAGKKAPAAEKKAPAKTKKTETAAKAKPAVKAEAKPAAKKKATPKKEK
jgi:hypothetical protein